MILVSRHAEHNVQVLPEDVEWFTDENNRPRRRLKAQPVFAKFQNHWWMLDDNQKAYAIQHFHGGTAAAAAFYTRSVAMGDIQEKLTITEDGPAEHTIGDRPEIHFGYFNTEEDPAWKAETPEKRAKYETILLQNPEYGLSFIRVDGVSLPAPWDSYDDNDIDTIFNVTFSGAFEPGIVLSYEKTHQNRPELVEAIEVKMRTLVEENKEDDALSTTA